MADSQDAEEKAEKAGSADTGETSFEVLEQDFEQVLQELMGEQTLEKFRVEYEKLLSALKKSDANEKRLMIKCRDLKSEILANASKLSEVMKLSRDDQANIAALRKEIEKAWKMVDAAQGQEQKAKDTIEQLKDELAEMSKLVVDKGALGAGQEYSIQELLDDKEQLQKQLDEAVTKETKVRSDLGLAQEQLKKEEQERVAAEAAVAELQNEVLQSKHHTQRELFRKEKLEKELTKARSELDTHADELRHEQSLHQQTRAELKRTEDRMKELEAANARAKMDLDTQNNHHHAQQQQLETQIEHVERLTHDLGERGQQLKMKEDACNTLKAELESVNRSRAALNRKCQQLDKEKADVERIRDDLKAQIGGLERDNELAKKELDGKRHQCDEVQRERDKLDYDLRKQKKNSEQQEEIIKLHRKDYDLQKTEIQALETEAQKQRKIISSLCRERDQYFSEVGQKTREVVEREEEMKMLQGMIYDLKKQVAEAEAKRKQQQNLYEAVRGDRNLYSKQLIEKQDEITETRRKVAISQRMIEQLKDEIANQQASLVKEHAEHQRIEKEKEVLKAELARLKKEAKEAERYAAEQQEEHSKLQKLIQEGDAERMRQKKELNQVINERDVLGSTLIRRNDELALVYERLKIQQSTLNKGESQYMQRIEDIRILRLEVRKLRREKSMLTRNVSTLDELRRETFSVQKELLRERTRCKALEQELENPMNLHRWRRLEGNDPSKYEMILKVQTLQRQLIHKTEEVVEKELQVREKEKLYVEMKQILSRMPGPETQQQVLIYQQALKKKNKELKSLASELNALEADTSRRTLEADSLGRELDEMKNKYYALKGVKDRQKSRSSSNPILPPLKQEVRVMGGGFSSKPPAVRQLAMT